MSVNTKNFSQIITKANEANVVLVAVSKLKPVSDIKALYDLGQRDFGENYVQELVEKQVALPVDVRWHFIGHLQSNKVKHIAPFVHLIHGVDSEKLLFEIDKQAKKNNRVINCLLQVHIATEETKFGFNKEELFSLTQAISQYRQLGKLNNVAVQGLMGMASFTDDEQQLVVEFDKLAALYAALKAVQPSFSILSMGMSADYEPAIEHGSTMIRVGSLLFGARN